MTQTVLTSRYGSKPLILSDVDQNLQALLCIWSALSFTRVLDYDIGGNILNEQVRFPQISFVVDRRHDLTPDFLRMLNAFADSTFLWSNLPFCVRLYTPRDHEGADPGTDLAFQLGAQMLGWRVSATQGKATSDRVWPELLTLMAEFHGREGTVIPEPQIIEGGRVLRFR